MVRNILPKKKGADLVLKSEESFRYHGKGEHTIFFDSEGRVVIPDKEFLHRLTKGLIRLVNNYDAIKDIVVKEQEREDYLKEMRVRYNEQQLIEIFGVKETKAVTPTIKPQHTFTPPPPEPKTMPITSGTSLASLYLIHDTVANRLKIGRSKNPISRIAQLQCSTAHKLEMLYAIKGMGHTERDLHKQFAHLNVGYEWFTYDQSIIDHFTQLSTL